MDAVHEVRRDAGPGLRSPDEHLPLPLAGARGVLVLGMTSYHVGR